MGGNPPNPFLLPLQIGLSRLYKNLNDTLKFDTIDTGIELTFKGDGLGHFIIYGTASDNPNGNRLEFELNVDQTYLPTIITNLKEVIKNYGGIL